MEKDSNLLGEVTVDFNQPFVVPDDQAAPADPDIVEPEETFDPITGEPVNNEADPESVEVTPSPIIVKDPNEETPAATDEKKEDDNEEKPLVTSDDEEVQEGFEDYSVPALLAIKAQKSGHLPEDVEVGKDLSFEDLMTGLYKTRDLELERAKTDYLESLDKHKEYVEMMVNGGTQEDLTPLVAYDRILGVDTETEENQRALLTYKYKSKGLSDSEVENLVEDHITLGKGKEMSDGYKNEVQAEKAQYVQTQSQAAAKRQQEALQAQQQSVDNVKTLISTGKVGNYELTDKEKKDMETALFKPTELYEYVDQNGDKQKTKVTKYDLLQHKLSQSPELQLAVFKFMMDGFKMNNVETDVRNQINDEINAALAGRTANSKRSKNTRTNKKPPRDSVVIGSQYLGEFNL